MQHATYMQYKSNIHAIYSLLQYTHQCNIYINAIYTSCCCDAKPASLHSIAIAAAILIDWAALISKLIAEIAVSQLCIMASSGISDHEVPPCLSEFVPGTDLTRITSIESLAHSYVTWFIRSPRHALMFRAFVRFSFTSNSNISDCEESPPSLNHEFSRVPLLSTNSASYYCMHARASDACMHVLWSEHRVPFASSD